MVANNNLWYRVQQVLAAVSLVVLSPVMLMIGLVIKLTSKGPVFYGQDRPGLNGRPFKAWKFRSMRPGSDKDASKARGVQNNDPQVTAIGRILRNLKLDELPQLWNVVRGEMALVGPRPIAWALHQELTRAIPGFSERLSVRPGLTNLGQICIDENADQAKVIEDWKVRFEAEKHYFRNRSVFYDIVIIVMTVLFISRKAFMAFVPTRWFRSAPPQPKEKAA
ncbi:MAG: sugar transferase [Planctomycetota bacterium]|nr:sugar transferase [Planctomycetota bacterium]